MAKSGADFHHLLLTRFNLDFSPHTGTPYPCDDEWHQERFELFNKFCLRSIIDQTNKNFTWIIFFNEDQRPRYKTFIEQTKKSLDNIHFIFVEPSEDHRQNLENYIRENCSAEYLITTRIDNDDAVAKHFIESIQEKFKTICSVVNREYYVINADTGYQFETKFPYRRTLIKGYEYSPFISLVSKVSNSKTYKIVLENGHLDWKNFAESEELENGPYWIQVVHDSNRANQILSLKLLPIIKNENFPILNKLPKNNTLFGLLMLPLQLVMTVIKRFTEKLKKR